MKNTTNHHHSHSAARLYPWVARNRSVPSFQRCARFRDRRHGGITRWLRRRGSRRRAHGRASAVRPRCGRRRCGGASPASGAQPSRRRRVAARGPREKTTFTKREGECRLDRGGGGDRDVLFSGASRAGGGDVPAVDSAGDRLLECVRGLGQGFGSIGAGGQALRKVANRDDELAGGVGPHTARAR